MGAPTSEEMGDGLVRVNVQDTEDTESSEPKVAGSDIETTSTEGAAPASTEDDSSAAEAADDKQDLAIAQTEKAASVLEAAGLSLNTFADEYAEKGKLSEDSMSTLVDKAGIPREIVEGYIAGQEALAAQTVSAVTAKAFSLAGSQEEYRGLTEWAGTNLSQSEQDTFNDAVNSLNVAQTEQAIRGLIQRRQASEGYEGSTVTGGTVSGSRADVYQDKSGMLSDLADARYHKSADFRSKVDLKVSRSMQIHGGSIPS
jgi:hypothetical protein